MRKNPISKLEVEKVEYIIEDIKNGLLILDHDLQRYSGQWNAEQKGNLIRRILHDGKFLPILVCTQYDEHGCEVKYLIDGVQRITSIMEYLQDEFPISKNTIDNMVSYDGIVYEQKILKSGKFCLKKDRKENLIPVLDIEGKKQRREQEIDIRGLRYSELPPELQEKIKRYLVSVQYKLECTDEDIQIEILDYNSGTKMNDAQIGKNCLGAEFARLVTNLTNHSFIINKCGFTHDNRIKGVIDRAVNEALMLCFFGTENWTSNHKDLCRRLSGWLTKENTSEMEKMFEILYDVIEEDDKIAEYLNLKEFFVVIANFRYFLNLDYKPEAYAMFLRDFIYTLIDEKCIETGELDDEGNEILDSFKNVYMTGTKQKPNIESRLSHMNNLMEKYLKEKCFDMIDDADNEEEVYNNISAATFSLEGETEELQEFAMEFANDELAIQSLMLTTDSPYANFENESMRQMVEWYKSNGRKSMLDDCVFYKSFVTSNGVDEEDKNIPLYIYAVKYILEGAGDIDVDMWISKFKQYAFSQIDSNPNNIPTSNSTIALKKLEIINSINYRTEKGGVE